MDLKDLMKTTPENLAQKQLDALKEHTLEILNKVGEAIKEDRFEDLEDLLFFSPAGDAYGEDSHCINFSYQDGEVDISEINHQMRTLKKIIEGVLK